MKVVCMILLSLITLIYHEHEADGAVSADTQKLIDEANMNGPYLGLVIPNLFELNPLLQHPSYTSTGLTIVIAGRRFRFGKLAEKKVILVMTGLAMINAGITTQLLLTLFKIEGVVHYGTAANADPSSLHIGDRYGYGADDEIPLEPNGDYTREFGYIKFSDFATNVSDCNSHDNLLNNVWYQPEEVFPVDGHPEQRQHAFWVPVDTHYFTISKSLENLKLKRCVNSTTCLSETPRVVSVERGTSGSIFLSNVAYRNFIHNKFNVSTIDMESGAVALICQQQKVPFIIIRGLSGSFISLAADNSVKVVVEFIKQLTPTCII